MPPTVRRPSCLVGAAGQAGAAAAASGASSRASSAHAATTSPAHTRPARAVKRRRRAARQGTGVAPHSCSFMRMQCMHEVPETWRDFLGRRMMRKEAEVASTDICAQHPPPVCWVTSASWCPPQPRERMLQGQLQVPLRPQPKLLREAKPRLRGLRPHLCQLWMPQIIAKQDSMASNTLISHCRTGFKGEGSGTIRMCGLVWGCLYTNSELTAVLITTIGAHATLNFLH